MVVHDALEEFVSLLLIETTVGGLCEETVAQKWVSADRFWRNFRRMLKLFGKVLISESSGAELDVVARLIASRSTYISSGLKSR